MTYPQTIYVRTATGNAELLARRAVLSPVHLSLLVLINGKRSGADLMRTLARLDIPEDSLSLLQSAGYIEADKASPAALTASHVPQPAESPSAATDLVEAERYSMLYQYLISSARAHLGLTGFLHHMRIEKAATLAELRALVTPLSEAISKSKGLKEANAFVAHCKRMAKS